MTRRQALAHYRRAAEWAREQMTSTERSITPPSTAGVLALLAFTVQAGVLCATGSVILATACLSCSALGLLVGLSLAEESRQ